MSMIAAIAYEGVEYSVIAVLLDTWGTRCMVKTGCEEERTTGFLLAVDEGEERLVCLCAQHAGEFVTAVVLERPFVGDDEP
jgi:hypothetical protein